MERLRAVLRYHRAAIGVNPLEPGGEADMRTRVNRFSGAAAGTVVVAIFVLTVIQTTGQTGRTPRTADGKPNLNGIWQVTNTIQMVLGYAKGSRTIDMDAAREPPADMWMGHSVGHWEGNTLVVDVAHFNDRTWFSRSGDFHSDALHLVERFTPITPDALRYEVTVEDPNVFTRPWKMKMVLYRQLEDNAALMDYRCLEFVEETFLGQTRKNPLVKHWEGDTIVLDVTRRIPPGDKRYER